jgi:ATP-binding cassette subfamily C (CFTR/MRP) protein 1
VLVLEDLCHLDEEIASEQSIVNLERKWESTSHIPKYRLVKAIFLSLLRLFTAPVLPNLLVMGLTFAQPFLVRAMLDSIASTSESKEVEYLIVVGYAVVYISKAICTAFYMHQLDRFATTLRGCLVSIIYKKTLRLDLKEAGRGESLTLMSADVEHIVKGFPLLHEISSNTTMTIIALGLLYRELGLA